MQANIQTEENPLGAQPIHKLLAQFAIPSIIAMLVSSLYNIVDQFFIGRSVGELGNAATNISFPLTISCTAISLLFGIGGASMFNISMGKGEKEKAVYYIGNAAVMLFGCGVALLFLTQLFLDPMLRFFGSPENVLDYAKIYTRITAFGFPFLILATGGGHLVRADGSPKFTMLLNLTGAIVNTVLDALFVFVLDWGMSGAAFATIIGQFISGSMAFFYLCRFKTAQIEKRHLILSQNKLIQIMSLGAAPCFNQIAMMIVQIVMNKSLKYYGSLSAYGEAIPIACSGIISKINMVFMSFIIGISQGLQPIASFNYGARKFGRVKKAYLQAIAYGTSLAVLAFLCFQLFPRQIISVFGDGSEQYYQFAINYFRIFLFFTFINSLQPISSNFFTSMAKPKRGIFLSMTRQILFLLPLIITIPVFAGIDGIMYAGPIADFMAAAASIILVFMEFQRKEWKEIPEP